MRSSSQPSTSGRSASILLAPRRPLARLPLLSSSRTTPLVRSVLATADPNEPRRRTEEALIVPLPITTPPPPSQSPPQAPDPALRASSRGENAYSAVFAFLSVWSISLLLLPHWVIDATWQACATETLITTLRLCGASGCVALAATRCLAQAAAHDRLGSDTYRRLNLGLMAFAGCGVIAETMALAINPPDHYYPAMMLLTITASLCAALLHKSYNTPSSSSSDNTTNNNNDLTTGKSVARSLAALGRTVRGVASLARNDVTSLFSRPTCRTEAAYALMTLGAALASFVLLLHPEWMARAAYVNAVGALGRHYLVMSGAAMLLVTTTGLVLKDAARRQRLAATTFRQLNVGAAGTALVQLALLVHALSMGIGKSGGWMSLVLGWLCWTICTCTITYCIHVKK